MAKRSLVYRLFIGLLLSVFLRTASIPSTVAVEGADIARTPSLSISAPYLPSSIPSTHTSQSHGPNSYAANEWNSGGPAGADIYALVIDPADPDTVFAGGDNGIYRTTNGGANWAQLRSGATIYALAIDPHDAQTIYAGGWHEILKSTNGGDTWASIDEGLAGYDVRALAIDLSTPSTVYAGTYESGVFKSIDWGAHWVAMNSGLTDLHIHALAAASDSVSTVYAATNTGIHKSVNGADSWIDINSGLPNTAYYALLVDPSGAVYVACTYNPYYAGVYRSSDSGTTWSLVNSGVVGSAPRSLATASGVLYLGTDRGVFRSTDGGERWRGIYPDMPPSSVACLAVDTQDPQTIYAGRWGGNEEAKGGVWQHSLVSPPLTEVFPSDPPKAVVIVGPVDAPRNEETQAFITAMEAKAILLENYGLNVVRLYHPYATWHNIRTNLSGASIVLYSGHGFGYDPDDANYLTTGGGNNGFCITDPDNLSGAALATQNMLIAYTQLARNAVIMIFSCYSAGASASDTAVVSEEVARRRVNDYAYTFLAVGAKEYFAGGDWDYYLDYLLSSPNHTAGLAYQTAPGYDPAVLRTYVHAEYPASVLWLDPAVAGGGAVLGWGSAFVGEPALTGKEVLGHDLPSLAVSPEQVVFLKRPADPDTDARVVNIRNDGGSSLSWQAEKLDGDWLELTPSSGIAPADITLSIDKSGLPEGVYTTTVTIAGDGMVYDSPQSIVVVLSIGSVWRSHVPLIVRNY